MAATADTGAITARLVGCPVSKKEIFVTTLQENVFMDVSVMSFILHGVNSVPKIVPEAAMIKVWASHLSKFYLHCLSDD
jgi:hypothetical protein